MTTQVTNPKSDAVETAAIIPARGGQQSIPYKNLQKLGDKTLLAWAIEVALAAQEIDVVVVSTEDAKIAAAAQEHGALVAPRPEEHSRPTSGDAGWYHHTVTWMEDVHGWAPELLVNLRPTGPLRFADEVDAMVRYMKEHPEADGVKSVIAAPLHPHKMWHLDADGSVGSAGKMTAVYETDFHRTHGPDQPRQVLQKKYPVHWQDAQVDITRRQFVVRPEALERDNVWGEHIHGYVLDERTSVDLDTPEDFRRAAKVLEELQGEREAE